jgi:hypothetical protein
MAERARLLGGDLAAAPTAAGFRVALRLPVARQGVQEVPRVQQVQEVPRVQQVQEVPRVQQVQEVPP